MNKPFLALCACLLAAPVTAQVFEYKRDVMIPAGNPVNAAVFTVSLANVRVQVLASAQLRSTDDGDTVRLSVRDFAQKASMKQSAVTRTRESPLLLLNGGFSGSRVDRPAGLLVSSGKIVSIPSYTRVPGDPKSQCPHLQVERFKLSGLLCTRANGEFAVGPFSEKNADGCREAIQAGPVLVDQSAVSVCRAPERFNRTAVCIGRRADGREAAHFVVTEGKISLFDLAAWMAEKPEKGGLGCRSAVNLSGEDSAGAAYYTAGRAQYLPPNFFIGEGVFPQASFLSVTAR